jgi:tetrapyrrole methylase family protein / MazG family protein
MKTPIERLREIMATLRAPNGCPWDREQTHESIKSALLEEAYELIEAIDNRDMENMKEELGDVLLQVIFHSQLANETGKFNFDDVVTTISDKLVRRHPHVFGDVNAPDTATVLANWNEIKKKEKPERKGPFDGIPKALPALMRATEVSKKAAKVGFDWPNAEGALAKVREETDELAAETHDKTRAAEELGDLLFAVVNLSRHLKLDAEQCLYAATNKFQKRYEAMAAVLAERGKKLEDCTLAEMDAVWNEIKRCRQEKP